MVLTLGSRPLPEPNGANPASKSILTAWVRISAWCECRVWRRSAAAMRLLSWGSAFESIVIPLSPVSDPGHAGGVVTTIDDEQLPTHPHRRSQARRFATHRAAVVC